MSFVQISIDCSFAFRAFIRENGCLEPRTSSLIIPGCEKKWKKGRNSEISRDGVPIGEPSKIINREGKRNKKEKRSILESSTSARKTLQRLRYRLLLDLRSTILSSLAGWILDPPRFVRRGINGNKMNVTRDVHCSLAQLYYLSWYSATVTINY